MKYLLTEEEHDIIEYAISHLMAINAYVSTTDMPDYVKQRIERILQTANVRITTAVSLPAYNEEYKRKQKAKQKRGEKNGKQAKRRDCL